MIEIENGVEKINGLIRRNRSTNTCDTIRFPPHCLQYLKCIFYNDIQYFHIIFTKGILVLRISNKCLHFIKNEEEIENNLIISQIKTKKFRQLFSGGYDQ